MTIKVPSQSTKSFLEKASQTYAESLSGDAELYLKNRGITSEAVTYFRLGLVTEENHFPGHEFYIGRLSIPYITPTGVVQLRFRAVPEGGIPGNPEASPKYLSDAHAGVTLFNTRDLVAPHEIVGLTEGETDAITVHMCGIPAVGVPGTKNWKSLFRLAFKFRKVIAFADNDDKGDGLKFAKQVQADIPGSRIVLMDEGYDVNKYVQEFGTEALRTKAGVK